MNHPDSFVQVYVKMAYTTNIINFRVYKNTNMKTFMNNIRNSIINHFNLNVNAYELVLHSSTTQTDRTDEEKDAFQPTHMNSPVSYYFPTNDDIAFYIRLIPTTISETIPDTTDTTPDATTDTTPIPIMFDSLHECRICLDSENQLSAYYVCGHLICNRCYESCMRHSVRCCPFCRSDLI